MHTHTPSHRSTHRVSAPSPRAGWAFPREWVGGAGSHARCQVPGDIQPVAQRPLEHPLLLAPPPTRGPLSKQLLVGGRRVGSTQGPKSWEQPLPHCGR